MSRSLSLTMREAANAQETGEVPVFLLTFTHADLAEPIRLSTDPTSRITTTPLVYGTVSRSNTYTFLPMQIALPEEGEDVPPTARLILDNVSRDLVAALRETDEPASVTIEMVLASDPDTVEIEFPAFDFAGADYDAEAITVHLAVPSLATEPYPSGTFNPAEFPGLFG